MTDPFQMKGLFGPHLPFQVEDSYVVRTYHKNNEEDRRSYEYKQVRARVLTALEEVARRDDWLKDWIIWALPSKLSLDTNRLWRTAEQLGTVRRLSDKEDDDGPAT